MISLIIAGVTAAASIASSATAASGTKKRAEQYEQELKELNLWYKKNRNAELLDSKSVKEFVDTNRSSQMQNNKNAAVNLSGEIPVEKSMANSSKYNKQWSETLAKIAAKDSENQASVEKSYNQKLSDLQNSLESAKNTARQKSASSVESIVKTSDKFGDKYIY